MTEIDIMRIFKALWHRAFIIVLSVLVGGAALFSYATFLITPQYRASAMMYVNNSSFSVGSASFSISSTELTAAKSLVNTYMVILNSRTVLNQVIAESGVNYTYTELTQMIEAAPVNSTEVFEVKVTSTNPQEAEKIANCICEVLPEKIADVVEGSSVRIVDYAVVPSQKCAPSVTNYTAIGLAIGLLLSCLIVILMDLFDQYIRSEEYLMQTYDFPVLAVIPDLASGSSKSGYYYRQAKEEHQYVEK